MAFGDGDLAAARDDALEGREADEGVAADLLAAFDRLQQEALALRPGRAQEGRDRGFEVGGQGAADGDEGVGAGQLQESMRLGELASCEAMRLWYGVVAGGSRFRPVHNVHGFRMPILEV